VGVRKNGSTKIALNRLQNQSDASVGLDQPVSCLAYLAAGDYVELGVRHNRGAATAIQVNAETSPEFAMAKLA
jgi:hypothetical protein